MEGSPWVPGFVVLTRNSVPDFEPSALKIWPWTLLVPSAPSTGVAPAFHITMKRPSGSQVIAASSWVRFVWVLTRNSPPDFFGVGTLASPQFAPIGVVMLYPPARWSPEEQPGFTGP
jgi:hypothetical protein